jgi:hypothetical protein
MLILLSTISYAQLVEIVPDSIVDNSDFVEKGKYEVYKNDTLISSHTKPIKAAFKSKSLQQQYPTAKIQVVQPIGEPSGTFKIYVEQSKLIDNSLLERLEIVETQNEIQSITLGNLLREMADMRNLDSMKISVLKNRIDTLQTFITLNRDSLVVRAKEEGGIIHITKIKIEKN